MRIAFSALIAFFAVTAASAGGELNGGTSSDGTVYFEVVPRNALEMVLWLESDRMGYLLSTVAEEAFIKSPELNMVFPTIQRFTREGHALQFLAELLTGSKKAPLYQILVEEQKLAPAVRASQSSLEIAGTFSIRVRTFPDIALGRVEKAISAAFARFEEKGFTDKDLQRLKAGAETNAYNRLASVLAKSMQLANYNEYAGSPDFILTDLQQAQSIEASDIWHVYNTFIKGKPYVLITEILLEPRWDQIEFARLQRETLESIQLNQTSPAAIANQVINQLLYGEAHPLALRMLKSCPGSPGSISSISRAPDSLSCAPVIFPSPPAIRISIRQR